VRAALLQKGVGARLPVRPPELDSDSFLVSIGGQSFRKRVGRSLVVQPDDADDEDGNPLPSKIRHVCTEATAKQVTFTEDVVAEVELPERGYGVIGTDAVARFVTGERAGVVLDEIQFRGDLVEKHGKRLCMAAVGTVELCFDRDEVAISAKDAP